MVKGCHGQPSRAAEINVNSCASNFELESFKKDFSIQILLRIY